jgi:hypothetical protein
MQRGPPAQMQIGDHQHQTRSVAAPDDPRNASATQTHVTGKDGHLTTSRLRNRLTDGPLIAPTQMDCPR